MPVRLGNRWGIGWRCFRPSWVLTGYWLRHVAVSEFTYDMGGRVGKESPLYHRVRKGPDRDFAGIVEFDRGPEKDD